MTTVYVTHDQIEAMTMADKVAVLNRGELQQVASPQSRHAGISSWRRSSVHRR